MPERGVSRALVGSDFRPGTAEHQDAAIRTTMRLMASILPLMFPAVSTRLCGSF